ncbi:uncharacterized protein LOC124313426 isoform X2 [Daphnia pulicaria]|uniref:uncharacterized protein LOC124313426 isoform X2 n=1 Tax=Daphnia pulicaria TaxID=35523 RepID=UPI001EEAE2C3|nr:uncharacterized protein LOC124313426 isoform X2 [Daphnia pulicaria]
MRIRVNQCCCSCCTLQTGAKLIGCLQLVCGIAQIIFDVVMILSDSTLVTYCLTGGIIGLVFMISVTIPILIAASKNSRPGLLLPWLIFNFVTIVLGIGLGLFASIFLMQKQIIQVEGGSVSIAVTLLGSALHIYFWLVIYSYYKQLKEQLPPTTGQNKYSQLDSSDKV